MVGCLASLINQALKTQGYKPTRELRIEILRKITGLNQLTSSKQLTYGTVHTIFKQCLDLNGSFKDNEDGDPVFTWSPNEYGKWLFSKVAESLGETKCTDCNKIELEVSVSE